MLRVSFSPVPECVVADCWNRAFPTPPCHQATVVMIIVLYLFEKDFLFGNFLEADCPYTTIFWKPIIINFWKLISGSRLSLLLAISCYCLLFLAITYLPVCYCLLLLVFVYVLVCYCLLLLFLFLAVAFGLDCACCCYFYLLLLLDIAIE